MNKNTNAKHKYKVQLQNTNTKYKYKIQIQNTSTKYKHKYRYWTISHTIGPTPQQILVCHFCLVQPGYEGGW